MPVKFTIDQIYGKVPPFCIKTNSPSRSQSVSCRQIHRSRSFLCWFWFIIHCTMHSLLVPLEDMQLQAIIELGVSLSVAYTEGEIFIFWLIPCDSGIWVFQKIWIERKQKIISFFPIHNHIFVNTDYHLTEF